MKRIAALTFAVVSLAACEQRDQGADLSACKLQELKTSYPEKVSLNKEFEAITDANQVKPIGDLLRKAKVEFIRLCMRTKGWTVDMQGSNCWPDNLDVARCYVRADNDSD